MWNLQIPVETQTLANGLRVVISPDHSAPIATVGVYYQIGFRLEPRGRGGFAHLFEHMMFQGSEHAGKMEHIRLINSSGGVLNGTTNYDITNYFEVVPSNALERVLWLEADRMRALKVDDDNLRNQRDVVKEEVRVNVLNQPYGGFPWLDLPPVAFRNWPNAHNFYGDFVDLDAATLEDVRTFFHTYYAPNNAVLLIVGDVEPKESFELARKYFESIPPHPAVPSANTAEPPQIEERRGEVEEKFGQLPALAIGYKMPERHHRDWYASALLDRLLHGGRAGRIHRSLVLEKQIAIAAEGGMGFPDVFEYNGPTLGTTTIYHKPEYSPEATIAAFDEVIADVRDKPIDSDELEQIKVKCRADYFSMLESGGAGVPRFGLMHALACFTLFDHDPKLVNTVLDNFLSVTPAEIQATARKYLVPANRSIVLRRPAAQAGFARGSSTRSETGNKAGSERSQTRSETGSKTRSETMTTASPQTAIPATAPPVGPEQPVAWPHRTVRTLANGMQVVLAEQHTFPKIGIELFFRSGNALVSRQSPDLAELTARVVRTGTNSRTSRQIEEDLRRMGANLGTMAGADSSAIAISGLSEFAEKLLAMVDDLARNAAFPADEFERERRQRLEELRIDRTTPGFLASERFRRVLFGEHPYAVVASTEAQVEAYRRDALVAFYRENYVPSNALLIAVGDFSSDSMMELIERTFGAWRAGPAPSLAETELLRPRGRAVHLVHLPGTVQTEIMLGNLAITRQSPDWRRAVLANAIYGGAFNSRLVANIREQKGYTYSPRSSLHALRHHGYFGVHAAVRNDVVAATLTEMFYELDRLRSLPVSEGELADAINYLSGVFSLGIATQDGLLGQLSTVYLDRLPEDYLETFREKIRALQASDVLEAARRYFDSANAQIVIVGDRALVEPQAALFGEVRVHDAQGKSIQDAVICPQSTSFDTDSSVTASAASWSSINTR